MDSLVIKLENSYNNSMITFSYLVKELDKVNTENNDPFCIYVPILQQDKTVKIVEHYDRKVYRKVTGL